MTNIATLAVFAVGLGLGACVAMLGYAARQVARTDAWTQTVMGWLTFWPVVVVGVLLCVGVAVVLFALWLEAFLRRGPTIRSHKAHIS